MICALPGTVARRVIENLPPAKSEALAKVCYGHNIATPISILLQGQKGPPIEMVPSHHSAAYCTNGFALKTPGDIERDGGCFHSYIHDCHARVVWDDDPRSIQSSGMLHTFGEAFPHLADRVARIGFRRWENALHHYHPGRMADLKTLQDSVGSVHFCGDYTWTANMDGAARTRSGDHTA